MTTMTTRFSTDEIQRNFSLFGLDNKEKDVYPGAETFGSQFKRCSILKETPTTYSSTTVKIG